MTEYAQLAELPRGAVTWFPPSSVLTTWDQEAGGGRRLSEGNLFFLAPRLLKADVTQGASDARLSWNSGVQEGQLVAAVDFVMKSDRWRGWILNVCVEEGGEEFIFDGGE